MNFYAQGESATKLGSTASSLTTNQVVGSSNLSGRANRLLPYQTRTAAADGRLPLRKAEHGRAPPPRGGVGVHTLDMADIAGRGRKLFAHPATFIGPDLVPELAPTSELAPCAYRQFNRLVVPIPRKAYAALMVTDTAPYRYPHNHDREDTRLKLCFERLVRVTQGLIHVVKALSE